MGSEHAEIDGEVGARFGYHGATTVGVDRVRRAAITVDGVVEEVFRYGRVFDCGDQPSSDIAGINVEDDVTFVPGSFRGSFQCGDVPGPHLAGAVGHQLGPDPGRVASETAAFADLVGGAGDPVHRGDRAPIAAFVELTGPHLADRQVPVGRAGQHLEHPGSFGGVEGLRWWCAGQPGAVHQSFRVEMTIMSSPGYPGQRARCRHGHIRGTQFGERGSYDVFGGSSFSALSESSTKSACAFPMISSAIRVFLRSATSSVFWRRSFSNSTPSAVFLTRFTGVADSTAPPVRAPASRARVHSMMCKE